MNYFIYPLRNMRITQNYSGNTSHKLHWYNSKNYKDYPIDDGGKDGGREGIYCPCDEMRVTAIKGVGNKNITNTIWLVSTTKVQTPTFNDYAFMTLTHSNDSDFKNIKVGTKFKRGELIVREGENVRVATHIHMTFGRGSSNSWIYNSNKKLVIKGNTKKPEEVCYIDTNVTTIKNSGGIKWVMKPKYIGIPVSRNTKVDQIEIKATNLRVRKEPGLSSKIEGYINKGIYNITSTATKDKYTWYKIDNYWIAFDKKWAVIYKKEETSNVPIKKDDDKEEFVITEEKKNLWQKILELLVKIFKK